MMFYPSENVRLVIPQKALTVIFDECDHFEQDETGGRIIGVFRENRGKLDIHITGIIESGPQAQRSAVSFFQDGAHQERIFRKIESSYPEIEHLGNWHTHHVNGLSHLSGGDVATYQRIVNHHNHNTPFFYALLVTAKQKTTDPLRRYTIKHYILHRGDERVYEIPQRSIKIIDEPLVWPAESLPEAPHKVVPTGRTTLSRPERAYDRDILEACYPAVRPFSSPKLGFYWRGPIEFLDGSKVEVVLMEDASSSVPRYSVVLREPPEELTDIADHLAGKEFFSACAALIMTERSCNHILYEKQSHSHKTRSAS